MGCNSSAPATSVQSPKKANELESQREQKPTAAANDLTRTANMNSDNAALPKTAGKRKSFMLK